MRVAARTRRMRGARAQQDVDLASPGNDAGVRVSARSVIGPMSSGRNPRVGGLAPTRLRGRGDFGASRPPVPAYVRSVHGGRPWSRAASKIAAVAHAELAQSFLISPRAGPGEDRAAGAAAAQRSRFRLRLRGAFLRCVSLGASCERGAAAPDGNDDFAVRMAALAQRFDARLAVRAPVGRPAHARALRVVRDRPVIGGAPDRVARGRRRAACGAKKQQRGDRAACRAVPPHIVAPITQGANSSSP